MHTHALYWNDNWVHSVSIWAQTHTHTQTHNPPILLHSPIASLHSTPSLAHSLSHSDSFYPVPCLPLFSRIFLFSPCLRLPCWPWEASICNSFFALSFFLTPSLSLSLCRLPPHPPLHAPPPPSSLPFQVLSSPSSGILGSDQLWFQTENHYLSLFIYLSISLLTCHLLFLVCSTGRSHLPTYLPPRQSLLFCHCTHISFEVCAAPVTRVVLRFA